MLISTPHMKIRKYYMNYIQLVNFIPLKIWLRAFYVSSEVPCTLHTFQVTHILWVKTMSVNIKINPLTRQPIIFKQVVEYIEDITP